MSTVTSVGVVGVPGSGGSTSPPETKDQPATSETTAEQPSEPETERPVTATGGSEDSQSTRYDDQNDPEITARETSASRSETAEKSEAQSVVEAKAQPMTAEELELAEARARQDAIAVVEQIRRDALIDSIRSATEVDVEEDGGPDLLNPPKAEDPEPVDLLV